VSTWSSGDHVGGHPSDLTLQRTRAAPVYAMIRLFSADRSAGLGREAVGPRPLAALTMAGYDATMKPRVYVETTVPSYLTSWPSRDLVRVAHQQITREWWAHRGAFEMSEDSVLQEVRAAREAYARSHGCDVRAMVADLREQDDRGDWPVVRLVPRRPTAPSDLQQSGPNAALERTRPDAGASDQS
jgi:hypothetical protein